MSARDRSVLAVVAVIAAIAASWMLVISPRRDQASQLSAQVSSAESELSALQSQLAQGQAAKREFAADYATIARLGEAVPADDNVASLIVQLQNAATTDRVDFRSLQLAGTGGAAPSTTGAPTTTALPPGATAGTGSFATEPFTFTFQGNFFHLASFFGRVQRFVTMTNKRIFVRGRLMTLDSINLGAAPQGFPQISATISATTFVLPSSQALTAGATPGGPSTSTAHSIGTTSTTPAATPAPTAAISSPVK